MSTLPDLPSFDAQAIRGFLRTTVRELRPCALIFRAFPDLAERLRSQYVQEVAAADPFAISEAPDGSSKFGKGSFLHLLRITD